MITTRLTLNESMPKIAEERFLIEFQGTEEDPALSKWIDLFSMSNGPSWQVGEMRTHPVGSPKAYRAYRLLIEAVPGRDVSSKFAAISNFQMFEDPTDDCVNSPCVNGQVNIHTIKPFL